MLGLAEMETWTQNPKWQPTWKWHQEMDFYQSQNVTRSVVHSGLSMSKTTRTSKIQVLVPQIPVSSITTLTVPFPLLHTYHREWSHVKWRKIPGLCYRWAVFVNTFRSNMDCSISCTVLNNSDLGRLLVSSQQIRSLEDITPFSQKKSWTRCCPCQQCWRRSLRPWAWYMGPPQKTWTKSWSPNWRHRRTESWSTGEVVMLLGVTCMTLGASTQLQTIMSSF